MSQSPFITYDELYEILLKKFNADHNEVEYWVNLERSNMDFPQRIFKTDLDKFYNANAVMPYVSDLPNADGYYIIDQQPAIYSFYLSPCANKYKPIIHNRLVYLQDLAGKRNWSAHLRSDTNLYSDFPSLDEACRAGLIRFYDETKQVFTYKKHFKMGDNQSDVLWINTTEGQEYLSQPDSFFLLEDILKIERIFFNKPREECLKELGIEE